ncbi:MAG: hypothetical protein AAF543_04325 [Pseudomonadota bacterium]
MGASLLRRGGCADLLRSVLTGTGLLKRVVRSLSRPVGKFLSSPQPLFSSLLLKTAQALMLAGIRCAGAGGGGPGH